MKKQIKQTMPLVSVIMTAYNAESFIDEAIQSILRQTYERFEFIIINDGSTDNTWEHIRKFAKQDKRIRAYKLTKNVGPSDASNFAFSKAKGTYIARMDADDISYPERLQVQVDFMERHKEVAVSGGQCDVIDEDGVMTGEKQFPLKHEEIKNSLFSMNPIQHPGCIYRSSMYYAANIKYEKRYFICHDLKILFRLLNMGQLANVPETLIQYRTRPNSITHKNPKSTFTETREIRHWALLHNGYVPTLDGIITHLVQTLLVALLPNAMINKLFVIWRMKPVARLLPHLAAGSAAVGIVFMWFNFMK